jgi:DNA-binding NtrC family response regulator
MKKILIVDAEIKVRRTLEEFLMHKGYHVFTAEDGDIAIEIIEKVNPSYVLLDMIMNRMSGIEVLKAIKQFNSLIKVFIITSFPDKNIARELFRLGARDILVKPLNLKQIETLIRLN